MPSEDHAEDATSDRYVEYEKTHDQALRDELVTEHLGLARILARRFANRGESYDDLFQVASLALVHALERFDPGRGVTFKTFATRTVIGELKHHFRDRSWSIRAPRRLQELYLEVARTIGQLSQELSRSPTAAEVASTLGVTEDAVLEAMEAGQGYRTSSIDVSEGGEEPLAARLGEDDGGFSGFENRSVLAEALATLPERERFILRLRFFEGMTQSEIAAEVGLSQMHVSRLLSATLEALRPICLDEP